MWGSDYPHSELTFPQLRKILAEILAGVPDDEQAKITGGNTARVYGFDLARLTPLLEEPIYADRQAPSHPSRWLPRQALKGHLLTASGSAGSSAPQPDYSGSESYAGAGSNNTHGWFLGDRIVVRCFPRVTLTRKFCRA